MPVQIHPIQPADIPGAIHCIQAAFDADPYNNWVFDKRPGKFNAARNYESLRIKCEWGMRNALFFVAKDTDESNDKVLGVGMWMKPRSVSQPQTWTEWADEYMLWMKQGWNVVKYAGWGGLKTNRYWIWKREQAKVQEEVWTDPNGYYFCNIVVVLPGTQGKGIGRRLMEVVTNLADAEGRKCYLESSRFVPNVQIYEKMGFKVVKKLVCRDDSGDGGDDDGKTGDGDACDLYAMVREPVEDQSESD